MKFYLLPLLLLVPFGLVFAQAGGGIRNSNNTNTIEKLEESTENHQNSPKTTESEAPKPAAADLPQTKDTPRQELTFESQKAAYIASYNNYSQQRTQRSFSEVQKSKMEQQLRNLVESHPNEFESYFFYYLNGQNDLTRGKALEKAMALKPQDALVKKEVFTYFVLLNKRDDVRKALLDLHRNNIYPESTVSYGEDLIASVPEKSTLITHGKEDSYAALFAQKVKRKREDVNIISLDWLTSPQFRVNLQAQGWILPEGEFIDTEYFKKLCALNNDKTIAISMTLPKEYLLPILDKLYVSGLVFEYKNVPTDMTLRNTDLWNNELNKKMIEEQGNELTRNYLPMLLQLKKSYESNGNIKEVEEVDEIIQTITNP